MRKPERYPYENAIEDLMLKQFNTYWSFEAVRSCPTCQTSQRMLAIRALVYEAMHVGALAERSMGRYVERVFTEFWFPYADTWQKGGRDNETA